jgi:hypothetical protein
MPKTPDGSRAHVPVAGHGRKGAPQTLRDYRRSLAAAQSMLSITSARWGLVR